MPSPRFTSLMCATDAAGCVGHVAEHNGAAACATGRTAAIITARLAERTSGIGFPMSKTRMIGAAPECVYKRPGGPDLPAVSLRDRFKVPCHAHLRVPL